jgi:hypothetical protein
MHDLQLDVITANASKLKNRGLAYEFTSSPYIITAFAGAKALDDYYCNIRWRWEFGTFAIIMPFAAGNLRKAQKEGLLVREKNRRTLLQCIWHYTTEFDGEQEPFSEEN